MPTWVLNICGDGESTSFLSNLLQCLNLFHSSFQNEILHIDLTFSRPHSFPHPHKHYRKAHKTETCVPLSHRLQRTETCLLCSTSFDSGVPITSSQHLPLFYSVPPKQVLTGIIPITLITSSDFTCFTYIKFLLFNENFQFFLLITSNPHVSGWEKCLFLMLVVIVLIYSWHADFNHTDASLFSYKFDVFLSSKQEAKSPLSSLWGAARHLKLIVLSVALMKSEILKNLLQFLTSYPSPSIFCFFFFPQYQKIGCQDQFPLLYLSFGPHCGLHILSVG